MATRTSIGPNTDALSQSLVMAEVTASPVDVGPPVITVHIDRSGVATTTPNNLGCPDDLHRWTPPDASWAIITTADHASPSGGSQFGQQVRNSLIVSTGNQLQYPTGYTSPQTERVSTGVTVSVAILVSSFWLGSLETIRVTPGRTWESGWRDLSRSRCRQRSHEVFTDSFWGLWRL